jgi:hypothetical protein
MVPGVEVKSIESHLVRATLGVRKQLVGMRTEMINQIRSLMKIFGLILPKSSGAGSRPACGRAAPRRPSWGWWSSPCWRPGAPSTIRLQPWNGSWYGVRAGTRCVIA